MNQNKKSKLYKIKNAQTIWSNLHKPDDFRGSLKHDLSFVITDDQHAEMLKLCGNPDKIAGIRTGDEGDLICKAKTTVFTKAGEKRFPKVYDTQQQPTTMMIGRGDTVNVNVSLYEYAPQLFTVMLNGVQIVAKNPEYEPMSTTETNGTGFEVIEGGFVDDNAAAPVAEASAPAGALPANAGGDVDELPF